MFSVSLFWHILLVFCGWSPDTQLQTPQGYLWTFRAVSPTLLMVTVLLLCSCSSPHAFCLSIKEKEHSVKESMTFTSQWQICALIFRGLIISWGFFKKLFVQSAQMRPLCWFIGIQSNTVATLIPWIKCESGKLLFYKELCAKLFPRMFLGWDHSRLVTHKIVHNPHKYQFVVFYYTFFTLLLFVRI